MNAMDHFYTSTNRDSTPMAPTVRCLVERDDSLGLPGGRMVKELSREYTDHLGNPPYVLFRTRDGRTVAWSREQYVAGERIARDCTCGGTCDCCRAVEYHVELLGRRLPL